jgi:hypothetical protein
VLQRRGSLHPRHAEPAHGAGGLAGNAEQPGEAVGRERDGEAVEPAPALVAGEELRVAWLEPQSHAIGEHFDQRANVAQAEVEPLARDRVNAVRRVADERQAVLGDPRGVVKPERE